MITHESRMTMMTNNSLYDCKICFTGVSKLEGNYDDNQFLMIDNEEFPEFSIIIPVRMIGKQIMKLHENIANMSDDYPNMELGSGEYWYVNMNDDADVVIDFVNKIMPEVSKIISIHASYFDNLEFIFSVYELTEGI